MSETTLLEKTLSKLQNNRAIVAVVIASVVVTGVANTTGAISGLWENITSATAIERNTDSSFLEAEIALARGDWRETFRAAELSASAGTPYGHALEAFLHSKGWGTEIDSEAADFHGERALLVLQNDADKDNPIALRFLGMFHFRGIVVAENRPKAVEFLRAAALLGDAIAQDRLGYAYERGWGGAKDESEAVKWFLRSANQNVANAQNNLGRMYDKGRGVAEDSREAVAWYRRAADQGHSDAQDNLGYMYDTGQGVAKDANEAVSWYRRSAEQQITLRHPT